VTSRRTAAIAVAVVLGLLCMAPTAGDVGGCGTEPTALDGTAYGLARKDQDCERCTGCGISTARCRRACDPIAPPDVGVPSTCRPLQHDGEVCIRALHAASCSAYATYVDDNAPDTPPECEFCKFAEPPSPPPAATAFADASALGAGP
jgi:hypothetical protein